MAACVMCSLLIVNQVLVRSVRAGRLGWVLALAVVREHGGGGLGSDGRFVFGLRGCLTLDLCGGLLWGF